MNMTYKQFIVTDFTADHTEQAGRLALDAYNAERARVPALPPVGRTPDLTPFADNGMGVAAFSGGALVGFLCGTEPFKNAFRSTDAVGVFSPMHANGTVPENRPLIYALLYQAAGEKWAAAGASSHAVCLYAHDLAAHEQFFRYGFGLRCVDAIRDMAPATAPCCEGVDFRELPSDEYPRLLPLDRLLDRHMAASPTFILRPSLPEASFAESAAKHGSRYFAAELSGAPIAFIKVQRGGETFICREPGYLHIEGAYCLPEYRGRGVYAKLLDSTIGTLRAEGYTRLGVDFESINPSAFGFWLKYFSCYTHSVVRRIDEHALNRFR